MAVTSWGARSANEPQDRTESRAAGTGPNDSPRVDIGKVLSSADNGKNAEKVGPWRNTNKKGGN